MLQDIDPKNTEEPVTVLNENDAIIFTTVTVLNENDANATEIENTNLEDQNANSQEDVEEEDSVASGSSPSEVSPAQSTTTQVGVIEENYDDEPDETIAERLWGLTEMFPDPVRDYAGKVTKFTTEAAQKFFSVSCRLIWVVASSSVILFAPAVLEVERAKIKESEMSQQKNVLLGPAAVMATNPMNSRGAMAFQRAK